MTNQYETAALAAAAAIDLHAAGDDGAAYDALKGLTHEQLMLCCGSVIATYLSLIEEIARQTTATYGELVTLGNFGIIRAAQNLKD